MGSVVLVCCIVGPTTIEAPGLLIVFVWESCLFLWVFISETIQHGRRDRWTLPSSKVQISGGIAPPGIHGWHINWGSGGRYTTLTPGGSSERNSACMILNRSYFQQLLRQKERARWQQIMEMKLVDGRSVARTSWAVGQTFPLYEVAARVSQFFNFIKGRGGAICFACGEGRVSLGFSVCRVECLTN